MESQIRTARRVTEFKAFFRIIEPLRQQLKMSIVTWVNILGLEALLADCGSVQTQIKFLDVWDAIERTSFICEFKASMLLMTTVSVRATARSAPFPSIRTGSILPNTWKPCWLRSGQTFSCAP